MVTASGEGLSNVPINKSTSFMVNTKGAGGGDIRVNVSCKINVPSSLSCVDFMSLSS